VFALRRMGITHQCNGTAKCMPCANTALLSGNVGRRGGTTGRSAATPTLQGLRLDGVDRKACAPRWPKALETLAEPFRSVGCPAYDTRALIEAAEAGSRRTACSCLGGNLLGGQPDSEQARQPWPHRTRSSISPPSPTRDIFPRGWRPAPPFGVAVFQPLVRQHPHRLHDDRATICAPQRTRQQATSSAPHLITRWAFSPSWPLRLNGRDSIDWETACRIA